MGAELVVFAGAEVHGANTFHNKAAEIARLNPTIHLTSVNSPRNSPMSVFVALAFGRHGFCLQDIESKAKNRFQQDVHRHGTIKKPFSIHSRIPCLLERRTSVDPHAEHTKVP
ncbi:MAG: hypothetical protein MN733_31545 [Nitrososphaera sp.]|nr:hypothetical protein [Nitrososphaera sp.]